MLKWIDIPPVWLFGFMLLASMIFPVTPAPEVAGIAVAMMVGAVALMAWAALTMLRERTTVVPHRRASSLVTSGPFRFSRNPIYLGDAIFLSGYLFYAHPWWSQVLVAAFTVLIANRFIAPEEARLHDDFGVAFGDWCAKVRRWF
ncbi:MAG: isoprenylcysteine carboxylmethyltransferase family protein [Pseudomonadota bacterium]